MSFIFEYESVLRKANGDLRFFGKLLVGSISQNDTVLVPVRDDSPIATTVAYFIEDFSDDWFGLPFYHTIYPDSIEEPFCVCVDSTPLVNRIIVAPSSLVSA